MTSRISSFKLVRAEMRQMSWLTAVQMLVFMLFFPFRVLMVMAIRQNEKIRYGQTAYTAVDQFCRSVGLGHMENTLLILLAGGMCALAAFGYVHSSVKQDFYHSLSLKREELFGVKYLSSTLTFVIAYLISQVFVILVGLIYQAATPGIMLEIAVASAQGILFFLCSYSGVLAAIMLTGNYLTTILAVGVFGFYLPILIVLYEYIKDIFWSTGIQTWFFLDQVWKNTSPWAWCLLSEAEGGMGKTGPLPSAGNLCQLIAVAAILTLIALALYRVRRTEAGGSALVFARTEPIVKIMMAVPAALVAGLVAYEIFESVLFEILFMLFFGALVCVIIEFIYRVDIHQTLSHKWHFAVTAVLACVIFFFFRFDLTGFNTYIPEKEELEAMSVSIDGSSYVTYSEDEEITYSCSVFDRLDALEMEDFDSLYEIAQNGVSNAAEYTSFDSAYDEICVVYMKYHLKNGKEVYRSYEVDGDLFYEIMDELMQDESVRELYFPICAWEEEDISEIRGSYCWFYGYGENDLFGTDKENSEDDSEGGYYGSIDIEVFDENLPDLIEAYRKDLETISYKEIYYANGEIDFYFGEEFININYPLSTAFTNTMELLEEIYYSS